MTVLRLAGGAGPVRASGRLAYSSADARLQCRYKDFFMSGYLRPQEGPRSRRGHSSSVNRQATREASASMASAASAPVASTVMQVPGPAASIKIGKAHV